MNFHNNLCAFSSSFHDIYNLAQTTLYSHFKLMCFLLVIFLISHFSFLTYAVSFGFKCGAGLSRAAVVALLMPSLISELLSFCAAFSVVVNMLLLLAMVSWSDTTDDWFTECQSHIILIKNAQFALILTTADFILIKIYTIFIIDKCINWRMFAHFMFF